MSNNQSKEGLAKWIPSTTGTKVAWWWVFFVLALFCTLAVYFADSVAGAVIFTIVTFVVLAYSIGNTLRLSQLKNGEYTEYNDIAVHNSESARSYAKSVANRTFGRDKKEKEKE